MNPHAILATLAQSSTAPPGSANARALLWVGILIVFVLAAGLVLMAMRRKLFSREDAADETAGLMDQLRAMRQRGELTEAEFNTARTAMRARMSEALDKRTADRAPKRSPEAQALIDLADRTPHTPRPPRAGPTPANRAPDAPEPPRVAPPGFDLTGAPLPKPRDPS